METKEKQEKVVVAMAKTKEKRKLSLNAIYIEFKRIDDRLLALQSLILESQYKQHGSVTLSLNACGKGCAGCPHATWYKWIGKMPPSRHWSDKAPRRNTGRKRFFAVKTKYPLKVIAQSRAVKGVEAKRYASEAVRLLRKRAAITKHISLALRVASSGED